MTTTTNPIIDAAFEVETVDITDHTAVVPFVPESTPCSFGAFDGEMNVLDPANEYLFAQKNLKDVIGLGLIAARDLQGYAKKSQAARDFEVLSTMLNTVVVANERLIDMQLKHQKLMTMSKPEEVVPENVTNVTNNFIGTTTDILRRINEASRPEPKVIEHDPIPSS